MPYPMSPQGPGMYPPGPVVPPKKKGFLGTGISPLGVAALAGAGYLAYKNKDAFMQGFHDGYNGYQAPNGGSVAGSVAAPAPQGGTTTSQTPNGGGHVPPTAPVTGAAAPAGQQGANTATQQQGAQNINATAGQQVVGSNPQVAGQQQGAQGVVGQSNGVPAPVVPPKPKIDLTDPKAVASQDLKGNNPEYIELNRQRRVSAASIEEYQSEIESAKAEGRWDDVVKNTKLMQQAQRQHDAAERAIQGINTHQMVAANEEYRKLTGQSMNPTLDALAANTQYNDQYAAYTKQKSDQLARDNEIMNLAISGSL